MEVEAKILSEKFLNNSNVIFEIENHEDRQLNSKGWQYKRYGNSTKGRDKLAYCRENMQLIEDNGACARNDSNPRYYENLIFKDENCVIQVKTNPTRSGKACSYSFFTVTKI